MITHKPKTPAGEQMERMLHALQIQTLTRSALRLPRDLARFALALLFPNLDELPPTGDPTAFVDEFLDAWLSPSPGAFLSCQRMRRGLSVPEAAGEIGISPATLYRIENGVALKFTTRRKILHWLGEDDLEDLAARVVSERMRRGVTQAEAAREIGLCPIIVSLVEHGLEPSERSRRKIVRWLAQANIDGSPEV